MQVLAKANETKFQYGKSIAATRLGPPPEPGSFLLKGTDEGVVENYEFAFDDMTVCKGSVFALQSQNVAEEFPELREKYKYQRRIIQARSKECVAHDVTGKYATIHKVEYPVPYATWQTGIKAWGEGSIHTDGWFFLRKEFPKEAPDKAFEKEASRLFDKF